MIYLVPTLLYEATRRKRAMFTDSIQQYEHWTRARAQRNLQPRNVTAASCGWSANHSAPNRREPVFIYIYMGDDRVQLVTTSPTANRQGRTGDFQLGDRRKANAIDSCLGYKRPANGRFQLLKQLFSRLTTLFPATHVYGSSCSVAFTVCLRELLLKSENAPPIMWKIVVCVVKDTLTSYTSTTGGRKLVPVRADGVLLSVFRLAETVVNRQQQPMTGQLLAAWGGGVVLFSHSTCAHVPVHT